MLDNILYNLDIENERQLTAIESIASLLTLAVTHLKSNMTRWATRVAHFRPSETPAGPRFQKNWATGPPILWI